MIPNPAFQRKPFVLDAFALDCAMHWMEGLPDPVRPRELSRQFPRIIRTIAAKWCDAPGCRRYLDSLQIDERGGRQGFPFEIVQEICTLREYLDALHPPAQDIWQRAFDAHQH